MVQTVPVEITKTRTVEVDPSLTTTVLGGTFVRGMSYREFAIEAKKDHEALKVCNGRLDLISEIEGEDVEPETQ